MTYDEALKSLHNMNLQPGKLKLFVSILEYGFGKIGESRAHAENFQKHTPAKQKKKNNHNKKAKVKKHKKS